MLENIFDCENSVQKFQDILKNVADANDCIAIINIPNKVDMEEYFNSKYAFPVLNSFNNFLNFYSTEFVNVHKRDLEKIILQDNKRLNRFCYDCENCKGCVECIDCKNCNGCIDLIQSKDCKKCEDCLRCSTCSNSIVCNDCDFCDECYNCNNCKTCLKCRNCKNCVESMNLRGAENIDDTVV